MESLNFASKVIYFNILPDNFKTQNLYVFYCTATQQEITSAIE